MSAKRKVEDISVQHFGGIGNETQSLTGSCHNFVVQYTNGEHTSVIIDLGAFQGLGSNLNQSLPFQVDGINTVIITHGHIDHCGRLPMLFNQKTTQFRGDVFASELTKKVAHIALVDSAKIFATEFKRKDAQYKKFVDECKDARRIVGRHTAPVRKSSRNNDRIEAHDWRPSDEMCAASKKFLKENGIEKDADIYTKLPKPIPPIFELEDVETAMKGTTTVECSENKKVVWQEICPEVSFSLWNAGHVAGASSVLIRVTTGQAKAKYYFFSGDVGPYRTPIHPFGTAEVPNFPLEMVVMETTYGDKVRTEFDIGYQEFEESVIKASKTRERLVIPCFALDRAQQVLYMILKMRMEGKFEGDVYLDSPLATEYTKIYNRYGVRGSGMDILNRSSFTILDSTTRELALLKKGFKVIITSSGMATGGPIIYYLARYLGGKDEGAVQSGSKVKAPEKSVAKTEEKPETTFMFMGYMAEGTLGRDLTDEYNPKKVVTIQIPDPDDPARMQLKRIIVKARVKRFNFISGHMDQKDLWAWYKKLHLLPSARVVLVHGERDSSTQEFKNFLVRRSLDAMPHPGVTIPEEDNILVPDVNESYSVF